jgi:hypothetical protein
MQSLKNSCQRRKLHEYPRQDSQHNRWIKQCTKQHGEAIDDAAAEKFGTGAEWI